MPEDMQEDVARGASMASTPSPDPTVLTTEALQREILSLRELLEGQTAAHEKLDQERFAGIDRRFSLVEQQRVEQKADTKAAVDAALSAQKGAVSSERDASEVAIAKAEKATTKTIDQLQETVNTAFDAQRRDLDGLKDRMTIIEGQRQGTQEVREQQQLTLGQIIASISVGLLAISIVIGVVIAVSTGP